MEANSDNFYQTVSLTFDNRFCELDVEKITSAAFSNFNCSGIEEFSLDESAVDEILGDRAFSGGPLTDDVLHDVEKNQNQNCSTIKFYFDGDDSKKISSNFIDHVSCNYPKAFVSVQENRLSDWNKSWRSSFKPIRISENMEIVPEWLREDCDKSKSVLIYPGMGFGTGNHETTYLCLKAVDKISSENQTIDTCLDFGCGSGILGISALKLGSSEVCFCDVDKEALDNCNYNLSLNFDVSKLHGSSIVSREKFEISPKYNLVFANILLDVLKIEINTILGSLKQGGHLVVSGILREQLDELKAFYLDRKSLEFLESSVKGDWAVITFKKII